MPTLTIDGKKIKAAKGSTLLDAAARLRIDIPTLCHHPKLKPLSSCRLCLVELQGSKNLVPSCSMMAQEGMVVSSNSSRVQKSRKMVLELLLSSCGADCTECPLGDDCKIQLYSRQYGADPHRFPKEVKAEPPINDNKFFVRNYARCIMCRRCTRACGLDIQHTFAVGAVGRGYASGISTFGSVGLKDSSCVFCGQCVWQCPTGALAGIDRLAAGPVKEMKKVRTVCSYCGVGCNVELAVADGKVLWSSSWDDSPVNKGNLCVKGCFAHSYIHSPDRLKTPLVRKGGRFEEVSWGEALSLVAEGLSEIKSKYGPDSIAGLSSAKCTTEENYLFQKFMRAAIGTNNIDHDARL